MIGCRCVPCINLIGCVVCKNDVPLMESVWYYSCIFSILLFMLTARPVEALPYAKWCLLFVGWALRQLFSQD